MPSNRPVEINLDFETRSAAPELRKTGPYRYAQDPTSSVMCASWRYEGSDAVITWDARYPSENLDALVRLGQDIAAGAILRAHNAEFEYAIWNYLFIHQLAEWVRLPKLRVEQLRCTAAEAAFLNLPRSLKDLCIALGTAYQKDMAGAKIMKKMARPRKPTKNNPSMWHEDPEDWDALIDYNIDDVLAESSCKPYLKRLSETELKVFHLTIKINERGLPIDRKLARLANEFRKKYEKEEYAKLKRMTKGRLYSVKQVAKLKAELKAAGADLPNLQEDTVHEALRDPKTPPRARELLRLRSTLAKSSLAKYETMLDAVCEDGRVRGCFMYYGASATGRWAGKGMQPHNFVKTSATNIPTALELLSLGDYELFKAIFPDVYGTLSNCLRAMIKAEKGKTFFDVDWKAIEARVVLWLAGDIEGLKVFQDGQDPYIDLAAKVTQKNISEVTSDDRQYIGKPGVLGGGFGMGFEKLAAQYNIEPKLAYKITKTWRKEHEAVVKFWRALQVAAIKATKAPGFVAHVGEHIKYKRVRDRLYCKLPSGRVLSYNGPKVSFITKRIQVKKLVELGGGKTAFKTETKLIRDDVLTQLVYSGAHGFRREIHGAHLCENVTQAVARDVLAEAMLRLDGESYPLALTLHDEIMAEVQTKASVDAFKKVVTRPAPWAKGLPLEISFWKNRRFGSY